VSGEWGIGEWGVDAWGGISATADPEIYAVSPAIYEVDGGTIATIIGANFADEFVPQVLIGPIGGPYIVVGEGYLFDSRFDLTPTKAFPGMPAMRAGVYSLRVKTPLGLSNVLDGALIYLPHADEEMAQKGRSAWSPKWAVGSRWVA